MMKLINCLKSRGVFHGIVHKYKHVLGYFYSDFQIAILSFIITVNLNKLSLKFIILDYKINF